MHAASMGEMNALKALLSRMAKNFPDISIVVTNTNVNALSIGPSLDSRIRSALSVLDVFHLRYRQFSRIKPSLICLMETEIWPNLLLVATMKGIPVIFLNARMTTKSYPRYRLLAPFLNFVGRSIKQINCQSEEDAKRFAEIFSCSIKVSGNLKFAPALPVYDTQTSRAHWQIEDGDLVIVFGSSRPGEEELILTIWQALLDRHPRLRLLIAPRHINRMADLERTFNHLRFSRESAAKEFQRIHFIDQLGLLNQAYSICDIAIVGGSFIDFGGHNPLEPAFYGKAIIMGPYHKSCRDSVQKLKQNGAILISLADRLFYDIIALVEDARSRDVMGSAARQVLKDNSSALELHLESIKAWL